ncbi:MAG: flagellin FliC3 [Lachnospiraceae bacterium]|nr:flagellin FliC3 [Lachnospiraceae bacterium]
MRINYNVTAQLTNNSLHRNDSKLTKAMERLSSGYKINSAKDNPSGLAMSRRMNAQIRGLDVAGDNSTNGISVIEIADGAMSELHEILQRMNELSVKSAHGVLSDDDRAMIDDEFQALKDECDRIAETTQYNGKNLLDGTFDMKGYTNVDAVKVDYYDAKVPAGVYVMQITPTWEEKELADGTKEQVLTEATKVDVTDPSGTNISNQLTVSVKDNEVTLTGYQDFEIRLTLDEGHSNGQGFAVNVDITAMGSMTLQVGSNEGQTLEVKIPAMNTKNMGILKTDVLTQDNAGDAINDVAFAIKFVSAARSSLGAYQNRLEHTVNNLDTTGENMTSAYSRIMDTDMAEEMTLYSTYQVVNQAATSMLAQANERPATVLQLLQ